jgi:hypothetical protein
VVYFKLKQEVNCGNIELVRTTRKSATKSEAELLDHGTNNLLRALKTEMLQKLGKVDREKLRKDGYSERLLNRLDEA